MINHRFIDSSYQMYFSIERWLSLIPNHKSMLIPINRFHLIHQAIPRTPGHTFSFTCDQSGQYQSIQYLPTKPRSHGATEPRSHGTKLKLASVIFQFQSSFWNLDPSPVSCVVRIRKIKSNISRRSSPPFAPHVTDRPVCRTSALSLSNLSSTPRRAWAYRIQSHKMVSFL